MLSKYLITEKSENLVLQQQHDLDEAKIDAMNAQIKKLLQQWAQLINYSIKQISLLSSIFKNEINLHVHLSSFEGEKYNEKRGEGKATIILLD